MNQKQTTYGNVFRFRWWIALVLIVVFIPVTQSLGQDEDAQRELEGARQRIHAMMREAEELQEAGRLDAAEKMRQNAHEMATRIEEHLNRQRHAQAEDAEHLHGVLEGLERGMVALRELGRHEELGALERVAHEVRRELEGRRERTQHERARGEGNEREMARHQLEILRMAMPALREGERKDAADLLERAIHARELALEGIRNEKAQQVRKSAPNRAQLAEILGLSSRLWREFGHKERAQAVGKLAEQMSARIHRERDDHAQREQERPRREARDRREDRDRPEARERRERERPDRYQAAMERIERLEAQIKRLGAGLERLQGQLHERERDRR